VTLAATDKHNFLLSAHLVEAHTRAHESDIVPPHTTPAGSAPTKIIAGADGSYKDHGDHRRGAASVAYIEPAEDSANDTVYIMNATYPGEQSASNSEIAAATLAVKALRNYRPDCTVHVGWDCDETLGHLLHARPSLAPAGNNHDNNTREPQDEEWRPKPSKRQTYNPPMARLIRVVDNAAADQNAPSWSFHRQQSGHHGLDAREDVRRALRPEWDAQHGMYKIAHEDLQALRTAARSHIAGTRTRPGAAANDPITDEGLEKSEIVVRYGDCQPLRTVVLGQNYDLTKDDLVLGVKKRVSGKLVAKGKGSSKQKSEEDAAKNN